MADDATLDEICITAIADGFRGDGEILCNPIGNVPVIAGRLAKATFESAMVITDTVSVLAANTIPVGDPDAERLVEAWMPYRDLFDIVWSGRRHIVMGASQIDPYGNQNFAEIWHWKKPKAQLFGLRGAPGNLVNNTTSYWMPNHSTRSFVEKVDVVSGPGYDRVSELSGWIQSNHEIRQIVSNLGVLNFSNQEKRMQLVSCHPNVTVEEIIAATGFELLLPDEIKETRIPTKEELKLIREVIDPHGLRKAEFAKK